VELTELFLMKFETPLQVALSKGRIVAFKTLLELGADPNIVNKGSGAALHSAVSRKDPIAVTLLCKHGANVEAVDRNGKTATRMADELGRSDIVEILAGRSELLQQSDEELIRDASAARVEDIDPKSIRIPESGPMDPYSRYKDPSKVLKKLGRPSFEEVPQDIDMAAFLSRLPQASRAPKAAPPANPSKKRLTPAQKQQKNWTRMTAGELREARALKGPEDSAQDIDQEALLEEAEKVLSPKIEVISERPLSPERPTPKPGRGSKQDSPPKVEPKETPQTPVQKQEPLPPPKPEQPPKQEPPPKARPKEKPQPATPKQEPPPKEKPQPATPKQEPPPKEKPQPATPKQEPPPKEKPQPATPKHEPPPKPTQKQEPSPRPAKDERPLQKKKPTPETKPKRIAKTLRIASSSESDSESDEKKRSESDDDDDIVAAPPVASDESDSDDLVALPQFSQTKPKPKSKPKPAPEPPEEPPKPRKEETTSLQASELASVLQMHTKLLEQALINQQQQSRVAVPAQPPVMYVMPMPAQMTPQGPMAPPYGMPVTPPQADLGSLFQRVGTLEMALGAAGQGVPRDLGASLGLCQGCEAMASNSICPLCGRHFCLRCREGHSQGFDCNPNFRLSA
jgi:hypothetical protein